jgi:hypothetical protein
MAFFSTKSCIIQARPLSVRELSDRTCDTFLFAIGRLIDSEVLKLVRHESRFGGGTRSAVPRAKDCAKFVLKIHPQG